jgi:hypothetical protein
MNPDKSGILEEHGASSWPGAREADWVQQCHAPDIMWFEMPTPEYPKEEEASRCSWRAHAALPSASATDTSRDCGVTWEECSTTSTTSLGGNLRSARK